MIEGKTLSGFAYSIPDEAIDDYELLEALTAVDKGDSGEIITVVDKLLGMDQKKALFEHIRKDGRVSAKKVVGVITEILNNCNQGKNS